MPYVVDFVEVSTVGLESSPVAEALAGLRANEARYFENKYSYTFTVEPASDATEVVDGVHRILKEERDVVIAARPLEATAFAVDGIRMAYVFCESGLSINLMYTVADGESALLGSSSLRAWMHPKSSSQAAPLRSRTPSVSSCNTCAPFAASMLWSTTRPLSDAARAFLDLVSATHFRHP